MGIARDMSARVTYAQTVIDMWAEEYDRRQNSISSGTSMSEFTSIKFANTQKQVIARAICLVVSNTGHIDRERSLMEGANPQYAWQSCQDFITKAANEVCGENNIRVREGV